MSNLIPLLFFLIFYIKSGIMAATQALMGSSFLIYCYDIYKGRVKSRSEHLSTWFLMFMCALTIFRNDPIFLVWKASIMYLVIPIGFVVYRIIYLESIFESTLKNTPFYAKNYPWKRMEYTIGALSLVLSALNIQVYYYFGESAWVQFKVFAFITLCLTIGISMHHLQKHTMKQHGSV